MALRALEDEVGRRLGDSGRPAAGLGAVGREVLDARDDGDRPQHRAERRLGAGLAEVSGDERFAWDSYRRLIMMFGKTVLDIDGEVFADAMDELKRRGADRRRAGRRGPRRAGRDVQEDRPGPDRRAFPQHPREQLDLATKRCSTPGTPTGPGSTGAASASRTTWAPRSTSAPWCSATSARPPAPGSASPATRPPASRASTATTCPTRRARTWSPASATPSRWPTSPTATRSRTTS